MHFSKIERVYEDGLGEIYAEFLIDGDSMVVNVTKIKSDVVAIKRIPAYVNIEFESNYLGLLNIKRLKKVGPLDIFFNFAINLKNKKKSSVENF